MGASPFTMDVIRAPRAFRLSATGARVRMRTTEEFKIMLRNQFWIVIFCAAVIAGCSSGTNEQTAGDASNDAATADTPSEVSIGSDGAVAKLAEMKVELGCGSCTYHMEGVEGCQTAAKVGDKTMLVDGDVDAHSLGLCKSPRNATVKGSMQGQKLVVADVQIEGTN